MIRHISVFFLKESRESSKDENVKKMEEMLWKVGKKLDGTSAYMVGSNIVERPPMDLPGVPEFGDVVQIIDFSDEEKAKTYVSNPSHLELIEHSSDFIKKVVVFDLKCEKEKYQ